MPDRRHVLTPEALWMMDTISRTGSFAAAARELGKVPSALTYNVRQLEDALDVLLFDRRSRQATFTAAGMELLQEGRRLLDQMDAVANRVRRVGTGWETQLSIAVDSAISLGTVLELCDAFYALRPTGPHGEAEAGGPGTRLRLRAEVLAGTWEALVSGQADLAIGVGAEAAPPTGVQSEPLGSIDFVFAVAPLHPLATAPEPIGDAQLVQHRAVAVADSALRSTPLTLNLLPGQDVLTVASMPAKIEAQLRGLGCGFVPEPMVREHVAAGHLLVKAVQRPALPVQLGYAWRMTDGGLPSLGRALRWWLDRLQDPNTRHALLTRHGAAFPSDRR